MKDFSFNEQNVKSQHGVGVLRAVSDFYSLFRGSMIEWIASVYDKSSGGFYFSHSARDTEGYYPDIESTGQALGVLQDLGLTPDPVTFPEPFRTKVVEFLRNLQDPDGFFYHPQWGKDINTSRRGRDLASASLFIEMFGSTLKYPSALTKMQKAKDSGEESSIPEHLRSKEAFVNYLDSLKVNELSYSAGQAIAMQSPQIKAVGLDSVCIDYLNERQYENGIWEKELNYSSANGMLKICHAYNALGYDLPRLPLVAEATVATALSPVKPAAITDVFNPMMSIHYLKNIVKNTGSSERLAELNSVLSTSTVKVFDTTADKLSIFLQSDGSFSYYPVGYSYGEYQWSQCVKVAPGVDEGNMNATQLARATQILITEALSVDTGLPYTVRDGEEFFALLD